MARKLEAVTSDFPALIDDLTARIARTDDVLREQMLRAYHGRELPEVDPRDEKWLEPDGKLKVRYELGIRLKMMGVTFQVAATQSKTDITALTRAYMSKPGMDVQEKVRKELDNEFKNLQGLVVGAVAKGLQSDEPQAYLGAANLWFKVEKENKLTINLTAEDIIQKLLDQRKALPNDSSE